METPSSAPAAVAALPTEAAARTESVTRTRLDSVDFLRGLVMVLMALDHTRDYLTNVRFDPLDLDQTTPALFFTRWITHFCAPVFVFLAGSGAFLQLHKGKSTRALGWFLLTRGLWLVLLELTLVRWGWLFNLDYSLVIAQVIWAIGWGMVALAALVQLPVRWVAAIGVGIIVLHNLLNPIVPEQLGPASWLWLHLHEGGLWPYAEGMVMVVAYPLLPWVGVIAAGYGFGQLLVLPPERRNKTLRWLGLGMVAAFVLLRLSNLYGDTSTWTTQKNLLYTVFSFIDTQKYPPSLLYVLMTLGPAMLLLSVLDKVKGALGRFFVTFGRVPLFYYLLHLPLIHGVAFALTLIYHPQLAHLQTSNVPPWEFPGEWGFSLGVVYLAWAFVVAVLYFPCVWFAKLKMRNKSPWLSYL